MFNAWFLRRPRGGGSHAARKRVARSGAGFERLESRLALAITLPIQDASGLAAAGYDVWVTGHGIPGWQAAGAAPLYLMSLGSNGSFQQTATAIQEITSSGTTATVTTLAPHGLTIADTVFIAGASVAGYDGSYEITVSGPTSLTYTTAVSSLAPAIAQGTVYTSALLATTTINSVVSVSFNPSKNTGLATVTTISPHGLSAGQTVQISGVSVNDYNGVFSVAQTPTATTFQVTYSASAALADGTGGTLASVALEPVKLSHLPSAGITLDAGLTNISAKLLFFVAPATGGPNGLPFNGNGVTPTDPPTPPYGPSLLAPTSIFDIVEFAYLPWGATESGSVATITTTQPHGFSVHDSVTISGVVDSEATLISGYNQTVTVVSVPTPQSFTFTATAAGLPDGGAGKVNGVPISGGFSTFDVSAVDGLAIPMTLTASQVKPEKVHSVGIRPESGFTRQAIGAAFVPFMTADPLGHVVPQNPNPAARDFSKLLYQSQVTGTPISGVSALWSENVATFTYSSSTPILQLQWVEISGFTAGASDFNGPYQVQSATSTSFTVTNTNSSLTSGSGGTVTPLLFQTPSLPDRQFASITAPKDWLGNQQPTASQVPPGLAYQDPLATFWDKTIDNFFHNGNHLSIYLGKEPTAPIYSGSSDGTQYTLSNGLNTYSFPKPTGGSLANALYVWSQANAPSGDEGLLQDQIWQALCRGVALDGVNPATINVQSATSTTFVKEPAANPQGVATITTASPHGLSTGASVNISEISNTDYNGLQTITTVTDTTFTFPYTFSSPAAVIHNATSTHENGVVTVTIATTNGLWQDATAGQIVYVELTSGDPSYSGTHTISEVDVAARTFKYTFTGSAALGNGNGGTVWGPLWSSGTGGTVDAGGSSTAWNNTTNWYTQHASTAFPDFQSVYCPYSKFLHYSTLQGTVDRTGTTSIFLHNAAYGFGEDENPIGNPYTGPLVPSSLDGTVFDDSTVTIRLAPWTAPVTRPAIDLNGDGIQDVVWYNETAGTYVGWVYDADGGVSDVRVLIGAPWTLAAVGYFDADDVTDFVWRYDGPEPNTGANVLWNMNADGTIKSNVGFGGSPTTLLTTSGDYNGDGITDLVWQMPSTDHLVWIMNAGGTVAATTAFATQSGAWQLAPTGADYDANNDGKSDLIWFNGPTHVVYLMNGAVAPTVAALPAGPANLILVATGDFNADGIGDLVWAARGVSTVVQQLMGFTTVPVMQSQSPVVGETGTTVDDSAVFWGREMVWRNIASGLDSVWTMSGSTVQSQKSYGGSLAWRLIRRPGSV